MTEMRTPTSEPAHVKKPVCVMTSERFAAFAAGYGNNLAHWPAAECAAARAFARSAEGQAILIEAQSLEARLVRIVERWGSDWKNSQPVRWPAFPLRPGTSSGLDMQGLRRLFLGQTARSKHQKMETLSIQGEAYV